MPSRLERQLFASCGGDDDARHRRQAPERAGYGLADRRGGARSTNAPQTFVEIDR
jgi:hypothetical protein